MVRRLIQSWSVPIIAAAAVVTWWAAQILPPAVICLKAHAVPLADLAPGAELILLLECEMHVIDPLK